MSNATDIKSLAQDMVAAYEERIAQVAKIGEDAATLLQGFDKAHSEMSAELKSELAQAEEARLAMCAQAEEARLAEVSKLRHEALELVDNFAKDIAQTADAWRDLVTTMQAKRGKAV